jgi:hypothetical protein
MNMPRTSYQPGLGIKLEKRFALILIVESTVLPLSLLGSIQLSKAIFIAITQIILKVNSKDTYVFLAKLLLLSFIVIEKRQ